jgi:hypothetical protein
MRPIRDCLDELKELVKNGTSGNFYLAVTDSDIAVITINHGVVDAVNFQGRRGDLAVELLNSVMTARASFHAEVPRPSKNAQLSDRAVRWLTGGVVIPAPSPGAPSAPAASTPNGRAELEKYRRNVESVAFTFLGPIAGAICESIFADCTSLQQAIDELAANLPSNEAAQFKDEVAKLTGRT